MTNPIGRLLINPNSDQDLDVFLHWCDLKSVRPFPLSPADIARFVLQSQALGIEKVAATVSSISTLYLSRGLADPIAGGPVADAVHRLAAIEPPRSWPSEFKERFRRLPFELRVFISKHEIRRDKEIHRAHGEAAALRHEKAKAKAEKSETPEAEKAT